MGGVGWCSCDDAGGNDVAPALCVPPLLPGAAARSAPAPPAAPERGLDNAPSSSSGGRHPLFEAGPPAARSAARSRSQSRTDICRISATLRHADCARHGDEPQLAERGVTTGPLASGDRPFCRPEPLTAVLRNSDGVRPVMLGSSGLACTRTASH